MPRTRKPKGTEIQIRREQLDSRELLTVKTFSSRKTVLGKIVRVDPVPGSNLEDVADVKRAILANGAVAVKVAQFTQASVVSAAVVNKQVRTPRQVVDTLLDPIRQTHTNVVQLTIDIMTEHGL